MDPSLIRMGAPTDAPPPGMFDAIFSALDGFNQSWIGPADFRTLVIAVHDGEGRVIGGLWGRTLYRWLGIQMLFVPPELRGQGIGRNLVATAECEARARGCVGMSVDTFSFQAMPFYERLGFAAFGALPGFPPGHASFFLYKRLAI